MDLKIGDVVRVKYGRRRYTIHEIDTTNNKVVVIWMRNSKLHKALFSPSYLIKES